MVLSILISVQNPHQQIQFSSPFVPPFFLNPNPSSLPTWEFHFFA